MKVAKEKKKKQDDANPVIIIIFLKNNLCVQLHQKTIEEDEKFENVREENGNRFEIPLYRLLERRPSEVPSDDSRQTIKISDKCIYVTKTTRLFVRYKSISTPWFHLGL